MGTPVYVVIDIQNDYFPKGAMELHQPEMAASNAERALKAARDAHIPTIMVQHLALGPTATFFRPGTPGADLRPGFEPQVDDIHLIKHYANAFRETPLDEELKRLGADHLVVAGMMTHMCIDTTCRAAADRGYQVTLLGDATATRDLSFGERRVAAEDVQAAYLAALSGSFAEVMATDRWIRAIHP